LDADDWRDKEKIRTRQEHWDDLAEIVLLASPGMAECLELIRREAGQRGRKISLQAAEHLAAKLDCGLGRIGRELEKLCLYRGDGDEISESDVEYLVGESGGRSNLSLADALSTGSSEKILNAFNESVPRGAYLPLILAEVARYLRQLLLLHESRA